MSLSEKDLATTEYISECEEILARVSTNLTLLEKGPRSVDVMDELYRDMHTMKGSAQLFGFMEIGTIAHAMETCLEPMRKSQIQIKTKSSRDTTIIETMGDLFVEFLREVFSPDSFGNKFVVLL